jgi:hypothetical protein
MVVVTGVLAADAQEPVAKILVAKSGYAPGLCVLPNGRVYLIYKGSQQPGALPRDSNGLYFMTAPRVAAPFEAPVKIAEFKALITNMRRGPRVAVSGKTILVTGIEREGFGIQSFRSEDGGQTWAGSVRVNSPESKNGEGFYDIGAGRAGSFHVVWIDERVPREAHLWQATSRDEGRTWTEKNAYPPGKGSVCECCWPCLAADNEGTLYLLFRNNLQDQMLGNIRDMHVISSADDGNSWQQESRKLGQQSWVINGCPVQGGALTFLADGKPAAIWARESEILSSGISSDEKRVGKGKHPSIAAGPDGAYAVWEGASGEQAGAGAILAMTPTGKTTVLRTAESNPMGGPYRTPSVVAGHPQAGVVAAWEEDGSIYVAVLSKP